MRISVVAIACLSACTSFTNTRSAVVSPGNSFDLQASFASSPGDAAGWLLGNNIDCAQRCGGGILAGEAGYSRGFLRDSAPSFTAGAGVMGLMPYAEGYVQLRRGERPAGVGARIGIPWGPYQAVGQVYGRYDRPLASGRRLLWNPALFYASGATPAASASFLALVNAVGLEMGDAQDTFTPSLAVVLARARHVGAFPAEGPATSAFFVVGLRAGFGQGKRTPAVSGH